METRDRITKPPTRYINPALTTLNMVLENLLSILKVSFVILIVILIYIILRAFLKKALVTKTKTKKMKHNVTIFLNLVTYVFIFGIFLAIILYFSGGSLGLGLTAGLLSAALGWALQRPITGIAAWIMVVITRPFGIGDRIVIGSVRGDVVNITLTHIYLSEFGGTIGGEETSGRYVIIPNAVLFEQNVINYTSQNEYILDEVPFTITYNSNLDIAKSIAIKAAEKITKDLIEKAPRGPFIRTNFQASGVDIRVRYYTIASERQKVSSKITEEIFREVMKQKRVEFAFPHMQIITDKKNKIKI